MFLAAREDTLTNTGIEMTALNSPLNSNSQHLNRVEQFPITTDSTDQDRIAMYDTHIYAETTERSQEYLNLYEYTSREIIDGDDVSNDNRENKLQRIIYENGTVNSEKENEYEKLMYEEPG